MSFINKRIKAFAYAFNGLGRAVTEEAALKIHLAACVIVTLVGVYFKISAGEWCVIVICCAMVLISELINTAIERLCDKFMPDKNEHVKFIKDISAAAVLISALCAVIVAIIIFTPYFKEMF